MRNQKIKTLILEDDLLSYRLMVLELEKLDYQFEFKRAIYKIDYIELLNKLEPDLILSDYNLPDMSGLEALELKHKVCEEVPFVFVTGTIGEEIATDTILSGADGFVLKNNFTRLGPVVDQLLGKNISNVGALSELRRIKKFISSSKVDAEQVKARCEEIRKMLDAQLESLKR